MLRKATDGRRTGEISFICDIVGTIRHGFSFRIAGHEGSGLETVTITVEKQANGKRYENAVMIGWESYDDGEMISQMILDARHAVDAQIITDRHRPVRAAVVMTEIAIDGVPGLHTAVVSSDGGVQIILGEPTNTEKAV